MFDPLLWLLFLLTLPLTALGPWLRQLSRGRASDPLCEIILVLSIAMITVLAFYVGCIALVYLGVFIFYHELAAPVEVYAQQLIMLALLFNLLLATRPAKQKPVLQST